MSRVTCLPTFLSVAGFLFLAGCASSPDANGGVSHWAFVPGAVTRAEDVEPESSAPTPAPRASESKDAEAVDAEHVGAEHEEGEYVLEFFFGYTTERADGGPTVGVDYSRHIARTWGMSAFAEVVALSSPVAVIGFGPHFRPTHKIVLVALPGIEFKSGGHQEFLLRVGGKIDLWETGSIEFAPAFYVDLFLEEEAYVIGLNLGINF
ncbi:MAG: hypothetical protein V3T86_13270 [Planctomycetota bacterium]